MIVIFITCFSDKREQIVNGLLSNPDDLMKRYLAQRKNILKEERNNHLGNNLTLAWYEIKANEKLMEDKLKELDEAMLTGDFGPSKSFYLSQTDIENSPVFQFIKKMPKGAALHTHHISLGSIKWIVSNLTYW